MSDETVEYDTDTKPRSMWEAEEALTRAKIAREEAEARKQSAEAESAQYQAEQDRIETETKQRGLREYMAGDFENRVFRFNSVVDDDSVPAAIRRLNLFHKLDPGCGITFVINSPGGSVVDGMALFDHLRWLSHVGHHVTTIAQGAAASMGGILLQAGDTRVMTPESYLLLHEVSSIAWGSTGDLEDTVTLVKLMNSRILDIFASRSKLTKQSLQARWRRRDWWISSDEALEMGLVDEVAGRS